MRSYTVRNQSGCWGGISSRAAPYMCLAHINCLPAGAVRCHHIRGPSWALQVLLYDATQGEAQVGQLPDEEGDARLTNAAKVDAGGHTLPPPLLFAPCEPRDNCLSPRRSGTMRERKKKGTRGSPRCKSTQAAPPYLLHCGLRRLNPGIVT